MTDRVEIFDTTLRDGEQAAGTRLGSKEKLEIAHQLTRLNVDVIEAGFPISSPEDFESVRLISEEIEGTTICGLSRAIIEDIDACGKALINANTPIIVEDAGTDERWENIGLNTIAQAASVRETALIPLNSSGRFIGYLQFSNHAQGTQDFTDTEIHLMSVVANQVATIIDSATLVLQTQQRARRSEAAGAGLLPPGPLRPDRPMASPGELLRLRVLAGHRTLEARAARLRWVHLASGPHPGRTVAGLLHGR